MIKLYLYHKNILKTTETHGSELSATRSGINWSILNKNNTYLIENDEHMKEIDYSLHMDKLLEGFI